MKRKAKKKKSVILRVLILFVCGYFTVTLAGLWSELNDSRKELKELEAQYTSISQDIEEDK